MLTLDDVIEHLREARRYSRYISALCPFHDDHRPSLMVYEDGFVCLACNRRGTLEQLLAKTEGYAPNRISKKPKNPWGRWIRKWGDIETIVHFAHKRIEKTESTYLSKRGIEWHYQKKYHLGYMEGFYIFPIFSLDGKLIGAVARASSDDNQIKYITPFEQPNMDILYIPDLELVKSSKDIFLVFGIIDALSLCVEGMPGVSTVSGKRVNPSAFDQIRKRIYIIPDRREEVEANLLAAKLGWRAKVIWFDFPEGCKDINDVLILDRRRVRYGCELARSK